MSYTADVISWDEFNGEEPGYEFILLAEGDSWFTVGGIPTSNLLFALRFDWPVLIVNCATPGDTIKHMSQIVSNRALREALGSGGYRWDAILLSGGGNDLIDTADEILLGPVERGRAEVVPPGDYCDETALRELMTTVRAGYAKLVGLRDRPGGSAAHVPMIVHTYDYIVPRNSPARFLAAPMSGPWLYTAMQRAAVPAQHWQPVADYLIERLRDTIGSLQESEGGELAQFHVVDTLGTLVRAEPGATRNSNDWLNEIHPNHDGYAKLADKIATALVDIVS